MRRTHYIGPEFLDLTAIRETLHLQNRLALSEKATARIRECRAYLEQKLKASQEPFYGINTGFGALYDIRISQEQTQMLQHNLLRSHACGVGEEVPLHIVRLMLILKIQSLSYGYSGVREQVVNRLVLFYNEDILPLVYQLGSLGASGDLAPLAHLSLPLIGEGEVIYKGQRRQADEVLRQLGLEPLRLESKEGIALLNGTQFSSAYAVWCLLEASRLFHLANVCGALALDAFDCSLTPFDAHIQEIRPHPGQIKTAAEIRRLLEGSPLMAKAKVHVQDPYAFRCIPQVHGASWTAIQHAIEVLHVEINSVTDNPNIFPKDDCILSGGNFHAQPLALILDYLGIALAELGNISERRTYQLISGKRNLPPFLTPDPGLNSGLMIPQYTAASIVSQNKQLATPASVDSIVSSNLQEDHVSMAANAATKTLRIVENLERILAIEFMTAAQALEFRLPIRTSSELQALLDRYRKVVPRLEEDRVLSTDIHQTIAFLRELSETAMPDLQAK